MLYIKRITEPITDYHGTISPSQISAMCKCQLSFYYARKLKIESAPGEALVIGVGIDVGVKELYRQKAFYESIDVMSAIDRGIAAIVKIKTDWEAKVMDAAVSNRALSPIDWDLTHVSEAVSIGIRGYSTFNGFTSLDSFMIMQEQFNEKDDRGLALDVEIGDPDTGELFIIHAYPDIWLRDKIIELKSSSRSGFPSPYQLKQCQLYAIGSGYNTVELHKVVYYLPNKTRKVGEAKVEVTVVEKDGINIEQELRDYCNIKRTISALLNNEEYPFATGTWQPINSPCGLCEYSRECSSYSSMPKPAEKYLEG